MSTTHDSLDLIVYAPSLETSDGRALAIIHNMERALPGVRLAWEVSEDGRPLALPRRDEWLINGVVGGELPLLCNGDEAYPVSIFGLETPAGSAPGGRPLLDLHAKLPLDEKAIAAAAGVLEGIADGARALWGMATPGRAALEIAEQTIHPPSPSHPQEPPSRRLPGLVLPERLPAPDVPHRLAWLNYWSAAAAKAIGFPDPTRDADLLTRARRTAAGAWIVRLTDAPLDLDNPTHLDALLRAYDRFPAIGGRANA